MAYEANNVVVDDNDHNSNGRRVAQDGERLSYTMMMMDHSTAPHGAEGDAAGRDAAYDFFVRSLNDGWKTPTVTPTPIETRGEGVADAGAPADPYTTYVDHLSNAWKAA